MARYGVQISQQGISIERAADYQKVLDSNWKFLDVPFEIDIDVKIGMGARPNGYYLVELFNHGLGYIPAFEFIPSPMTIESDPKTQLTNGYTESLKLIKADSQRVVANLLYSGTNIELRLVGKLRVFALDILTEHIAPTVPITTTSKQSISRYGAKFLDLNKGKGDIEDESMLPFTLNTRGKQVSIHKHGTQRAADGLLTITHNVGYPPTYLLCKFDERASWNSIYAYPFDTDVVVGSLVNAYYLAKPTSTTIQFKGAQTTLQGMYGYVILKDPAEIAG